jgi:hypothetical protein
VLSSTMFDQGSSSGPPQFDTAEYKDAPSADTCRVCGQPLPGVFYRANRALVCVSCADRIRRAGPNDSRAAFIRGLVFGTGGFVLGLILYAGFTIITDIQIGFMSLGVGWIVGKAILLGSGGIGGRRYQIAAVLLTYAAVSIAFVPIAFHYVGKQRTAETQQNAPGNQSSATGQQEPPSAGLDTSGKTRQAPGLVTVIGRMILFGLASPFLELQSGISGVIGFVILLVGMQFAWKMTVGRPKIVLNGPFDNSKSAPAT